MDALSFLRFGRVIGGVRALRVPGYRAGGGKLCVVVRPVPVAGPLPDVARHVIEAISIRWEMSDWRNTAVAVVPSVRVGEVTLMRICHPLVMFTKLVSPRIGLAGKPAASGELPLGLCRQAFPRPLCIGQRIVVGNVHDRIVFLALDVAFWAKRVTPVRSPDVIPPLKLVVQRDSVVGRREHDGTGDEVLRGRARKVFRARFLFRYRDVTSGSNKFAELRVRDVGLVHPETIDVHPVDRAGIQSTVHPGFRTGWRIHGAHGEFAAWNPNHACGSLRNCLSGICSCRDEYSCRIVIGSRSGDQRLA